MGDREVITRHTNILKWFNGELDGHILTPESAANDLVNRIDIDILKNPDSRYLDPCVKSAIFFVALYNKLMQTLKDVMPDEVIRSHHICCRQLYGIALSRASQLLAGRVLFGKNYKHDNTVLAPDYYLESIKLKDRNIIQETIAERIYEHMKFDIIIGNPPYQEGTGGGATTEVTMPLYNYFVEKAIAMEPSLVSMIIPSRWMSGGKSVLDNFRRTMVEGRHIKSIHNYERASDVFSGPDIAGGVQFFTYSKKYIGPVEFHNCQGNQDSTVEIRDIACHTYRNAYNKEQYMVIADNRSALIADNIKKISKSSMDSSVLQYSPFGLCSNFEDGIWETEEKPIKVICSGGRETWTDIESITQNRDIIGKWKVCTGYKNPDRGGANECKTYNVINKPRILGPGEACSMSYLVLEVFDNEQEAKNMMQYIKTKLARFLIMCTITSTALTSRNFMFVPIQDYSKSWTDAELYKKYNLTQEQIDYIESRIKAMG